MCKRDTPLEGVVSKLFDIRNPAGKMMEYRGRDIKRDAQPAPEEYITIKACTPSLLADRYGSLWSDIYHLFDYTSGDSV